MKSSEKANRYKKIIMLQEQVVLKLQSQHLKQIEECSNLRHKVRRLIGNYKKAKTELKAYKLYSEKSNSKSEIEKSLLKSG